jgi:hypothetical protein
VREAVEARGATVLYLPPYSPDLNQIEQAVAKLKQPLRAAAFQLLGNIADPGICNLPTLTPVTTLTATYTAAGTPVTDTYTGIKLWGLLDRCRRRHGNQRQE